MIPTLYMLKGLPGAGKTTKAKQMVALGAKRISRDDLRAMVDSGVYNADNERLIRYFCDALIVKSLKHGYDVVDDNTNLRPKDESNLRALASICGAYFVIIKMKTSTEECIRRDALRDNPVGETAIRSMEKLEPNPLLNGDNHE